MEEHTQKYKVFIVDDDPFVLDMYVLKFKEEGFEVVTASSGKNVVLRIKEEKPDIILLDVIMPMIDGFEILRSLQKENLDPKPKIIFLTNFGQKEDVERGLQLGADDYIIKAHFTPREVVEKIKSLLN